MGNRFRHASVDYDNREQDNNGFLWGFPFLGNPWRAQKHPGLPWRGRGYWHVPDPPPGGKPAGLEVKGTSERMDDSLTVCLAA